jgi:hypothetical protein
MTSLFGKKLTEYKGIPVYSLSDAEVGSAKAMIGKGLHDYQAARQAKGMVTDSADCTYLFPEIIRQSPLPNNAAMLGLTLDNRVGWASTTTHKYEQVRYIAPGSLTCCDDVPLMPKQLPPTRKTYGLETLAVAYDACALDHYIECGPEGYSLLRTDQDNQRLAMEAISYAASQIAFKGSADSNIMGFANNPDIPSIMMPSVRATGMAWVESFMTALSWVRNANASWEQGLQPTKFILALPPSVHSMLLRKLALGPGQANPMNVLNYFISGGMAGAEQPLPGVTIEIKPIPELEYVMGGPTGMLIEDRPGLLPWIRPTFDQSLNPVAGKSASPYVISPPFQTGHYKQEVCILTRVGSIVPQMTNRLIKMRFARVPMATSSIYASDYLYSQQKGDC